MKVWGNIELLEAERGSRRFYEVIVDGVEVSIRYSRIGDRRQP